MRHAVITWWGHIGWGYPNDWLKSKPILKTNGLFVLGQMNDIAICDVKHKVYPVANCDHLENDLEVPI